MSRPVVRRAFTLVELLVVIGIIAVLVGILLPVLGRAREAANTVKCAANLRQIGQLLYLYAGSNHGLLPYGYWNGAPTPNGTADGSRAGDWSTLLGHTMDPRTPNNYADAKAYSIEHAGGRGVFICPSAIPQTVDGLIVHYSAHPRLMPALNFKDGNIYEPAPPSGKSWYFTPYPIAKIRHASDIAIIYDGAQKTDSGGPGTDGMWGANVWGDQLDQGRVYWQTWLTSDLPSSLITSNTYLVGSNPIDTSSNTAPNPDIYWNTDTTQNWGQIRFRHGRGRTGVFNQVSKANVLFVDGHVDSFFGKDNHNTDLLRRNVYVNNIENHVAY